jgi:4-alpha-glucanotransferase
MGMTSVLSVDRRMAGVLTPLFALRSTHDLGCGDLGSLRDFIAWAARLSFHCVQLLPVNETGADHSPYNAISSVAIEPTTLDLAAVPDLQPAEIDAIADQYGVAQLREGSVRWLEVKSLKHVALRRAFANFSERHWEANDGRALDFTRFTEQEAAWLESYALFRVFVERQGTEQWDQWPLTLRSFDTARAWLAEQRAGFRSEIEQDLRYYKYVQWLAFGQWREVKRFADTQRVILMGDIPFGVSYYSADVWALPELFDHQWSGGAPPEPAFWGDDFVRRWGQNWGVPLYRWEAHRKAGFAWWRQRARGVAEGFHLFRIDHVLGFYRIYGFPWRPQRNAEFTPLTDEEAMERTGGELPHYIEHDDDTPEHKAANRAQGEELLRVLQSEVGAHALVGEDLGTVPDYVRPSLLSLGIPGFKVPHWETDPAYEPERRIVPGNEYPRCSIATYATHDHDPLRMMWSRWMSTIEAALREPDRLAAERDAAWQEARQLASWAGFEVDRIRPFEEVHEAFLRGLFRSNSWLAVVMITDLLGTDQRFNVPGSVADSNWSARLPEGWMARYAPQLNRAAELIRESGRA